MDDSIKHGLCIPYVVRDTPDKGRGLFAGTAIPKRTTVWRHVEGQFEVYDEQSLRELLSNLTETDASYELEHIYCMEEFPAYMIRVLDDGVLINHSSEPTVRKQTSSRYNQGSTAASSKDVSTALLGGYFTLVATRDIEKGEELTLDYNDDPDDPDYYDALCEQYDVKWDWF